MQVIIYTIQVRHINLSDVEIYKKNVNTEYADKILKP